MTGPSPLDAPAGRRDPDLWAAYIAAKRVADTSLRLTDMRAAVAAYEAWLAVAIPDARARREVWP